MNVNKDINHLNVLRYFRWDLACTSYLISTPRIITYRLILSSNHVTVELTLVLIDRVNKAIQQLGNVRIWGVKPKLCTAKWFWDEGLYLR